METDLTRKIKRACHKYNPKMHTGMRTIRYADEVWTQNGIVDVIRFEDYIVSRHEKCKAAQCKIPEETFPNKHCKGCLMMARGVPEIGICTTAFEVKITKSDFKSKNGHSIDDITKPIANENYYAVPKELVKDIEELVPTHIGILAYQKSGYMRRVKKATWINVSQEVILYEMYNALKKWCGGVMKIPEWRIQNERHEQNSGR